jgi:hypothetical protein
VSIDEITDASGRKIANVIVIEVLKNDHSTKEIVSSVMPGNVCCESHNNSTCF